MLVGVCYAHVNIYACRMVFMVFCTWWWVPWESVGVVTLVIGSFLSASAHVGGQNSDTFRWAEKAPGESPCI